MDFHCLCLRRVFHFRFVFLATLPFLVCVADYFSFPAFISSVFFRFLFVFQATFPNSSTDARTHQEAGIMEPEHHHQRQHQQQNTSKSLASERRRVQEKSRKVEEERLPRPCPSANESSRILDDIFLGDFYLSLLQL